MSIANTPADFSPAKASLFRADEVILEPTKRWTVAEYHELIRLGLLTEDDPYELIEGWLVRKMTKNSPHNAVVRKLIYHFSTRLDLTRWVIDCQNSLTLDDGEPEPDFAVLQGPASNYESRNPQGAEAKLVVEVSDSTLDRDTGMKLRSYARAGIPQYWIVNLRYRQIEVYSRPNSTSEPAQYEVRNAYQAGESVPVFLDGQELFQLLAEDILPQVNP